MASVTIEKIDRRKNNDKFLSAVDQAKRFVPNIFKKIDLNDVVILTIETKEGVDPYNFCIYELFDAYGELLDSHVVDIP